jgi:drug/metabolite transporter (DMT)-like permease
MVEVVNALGGAVIAVLGFWLAYVERKAPYRWVKIGLGVLGVVVTLTGACSARVQARDIAFAKYGAAVTLHALGGGL